VERSEPRDKRELILDAALNVFSRRGVFASRIADIATEAGVAYGLVYHYFRNKEEILNTIFEERWARVSDLLEEADQKGNSLEERLREAANLFLSAYRRRPQLVEVLLLEFTRTSNFLEPVHLDRIGRAFAVVRGMLERGQEEGEVRNDLPADLLMLLFLGGVQMIIQTQVLGVFEEPEQFEEQGAGLVTDAFLKGARPR
jgi:AcrR family transcriptional regulator